MPDSSPTPAKRTRRPAKETKRLLVAAAGDVLVEKGGELEMGDVAKRAGVSTALAHYHFGNKAGLLTAVVADFYARMDDAIIAVPYEGARWIDREQARIRDLISFFLDDPLAPIIIGSLQNDPSLGPESAERARRVARLGALNIAEAQREGDIDGRFDPELLVSMILGGVMAGLTQAVSATPRPNKAQVEDEIIGFVARAAGQHWP